MGKVSVPGPKTRAEISDFLHKLADQIGGGEQLIIGSDRVTVPERLASKIKHKRKHGIDKIKISLSWPVETYGSDAMIGDYVVPHAPPVDFKALKKAMQLALNSFRRQISEGRVPAADELARYAALQRDFAKRAKPAWATGIAQADEATDDLVVACERADVVAAGRAVDRLLELKKIYHDRFK